MKSCSFCSLLEGWSLSVFEGREGKGPPGKCRSSTAHGHKSLSGTSCEICQMRGCMRDRFRHCQVGDRSHHCQVGGGGALEGFLL